MSSDEAMIAAHYVAVNGVFVPTRLAGTSDLEDMLPEKAFTAKGCPSSRAGVCHRDFESQ